MSQTIQPSNLQVTTILTRISEYVNVIMSMLTCISYSSCQFPTRQTLTSSSLSICSLHFISGPLYFIRTLILTFPILQIRQLKRRSKGRSCEDFHQRTRLKQHLWSNLRKQAISLVIIDLRLILSLIHSYHSHFSRGAGLSSTEQHRSQLSQ